MAEYFQLPYDEAVEAVEATAGASEADQDARDVLLAALAQGKKNPRIFWRQNFFHDI